MQPSFHPGSGKEAGGNSGDDSPAHPQAAKEIRWKWAPMLSKSMKIWWVANYEISEMDWVSQHTALSDIYGWPSAIVSVNMHALWGNFLCNIKVITVCQVSPYHFLLFDMHPKYFRRSVITYGSLWCVQSLCRKRKRFDIIHGTGVWYLLPVSLTELRRIRDIKCTYLISWPHSQLYWINIISDSGNISITFCELYV